MEESHGRGDGNSKENGNMDPNRFTEGLRDYWMQMDICQEKRREWEYYSVEGKASSTGVQSETRN